jgi:hypothetical protein
MGAGCIVSSLRGSSTLVMISAFSNGYDETEGNTGANWKIRIHGKTFWIITSVESWQEARSIVEHQHEHLLTKAATGTLQRILKNETGEYTNDDLIFVSERLRFLEEARSTSIAAAWESLSRRLKYRR